MEGLFDIGEKLPKDKRTFFYDSSLPSLPLPSIHQTIEKYLDSCKAILTDEEYKETERVCRQFSEDEAMNLQIPLMNKATQSFQFCPGIAQRYESNQKHPKVGANIPLLERSAIALYNVMQFWGSLKYETYPQHRVRDGSCMTMRQFRFMFNTCRIPQRDQDTIYSSFKTHSEGESPTHIIIFFRNRMYKIQGLNADTGAILTPPEFYGILKTIVDRAPRHYGKSISALTCLERDTWAEARDHMMNLSSLNEENLKDIYDALICFALDESMPQDDTELYRLGLQGPCGNRWNDKSFNYACTANGGFVSTCDHSPYEALILTVFVQTATELMKKATRDFSKPWKSKSFAVKELVFDLDDKLNDYIRQGLTENNKFDSNLQVKMKMYTEIGKSPLKKLKVHPDGFVQICIQLTYMKMYGRPAPTYETATTRSYYNGRTETARTCTPETVNFCRAFINDSPDVVLLFYKAHDKFVWLMGECKNGFGCDRHLMGISLQAIENGEPIPALFSDPAFKKTGGGGNFILSTSFTGYFDATGGVAPMVDNGYGTFYCINNNRMFITTSAWNSCHETDADKFLTSLLQTMSLVYRMLEKSTVAKL